MAATTLSVQEYLQKAGTSLPPSDWLTLDQDRINTFADCTEDHLFIHIDEAAAAQTPFGGTIAHGFLTLSVLSKLCTDNVLVPEGMVMGINYGFDKVRFLTPVRAGKRVRAQVELMSIEQKDPNRFLVKQGVTVEIEGEATPALYAEWLTMQVTG